MSVAPKSIARIAVLASGFGSGLQSLLDHFSGSAQQAGQIVWVGSNRAVGGALDRAQHAGIATLAGIKHTDGDALLQALDQAHVDVLVLAGYLKLVPISVVRAFHGRLLNVHPALLPAFGGAGMYGERVHAAVLASGATLSGPTVHFVDEVYDRGAIIAQWPVPVLPNDTPASLGARVLHTEHRLLPLCVEGVAAGAITLGNDGRAHGSLRGTSPIASQTSNDPLRFTLVHDHAPSTASSPFDPAAADSVRLDFTTFDADVARLFPR